MKQDIAKSLKTGAWVTVVVLILSYILSYLNIPVKQVFGITPATAITTTIGNKVIAILQKLVAFDIASIIYLFISAVLIVLVGTWIYGAVNIPKTTKNWSKLAAILFWGTAAFYLLLVGFGLPSVGTIIGLGVYYIVIAISLSVLQKQVSKWKLI